MNAGQQIKGQSLYQRQQRNRSTTGPAIICDGIQTPENLGAILRVADAAGNQRVILLDSNIDLKNKKLSKLARSTDRHLQIEHLSLEQFTNQRPGFGKVFALEITTHSANVFETDASDCDAILVGHESHGVRDEILQLCDAAVHLPMFGTNGSMNISHALAIFLYERHRQTQYK